MIKKSNNVKHLVPLQNGEAIGIIGPSGAGKTTLVDVLLGLLEPSEGEIRYNDVLLSESIALSSWELFSMA